MWGLSRFGHVWLFVTLWTGAHQTPPSMGFSRQEHWTGLPFPSPGNPPDPGFEPASLTSACTVHWAIYRQHCLGSPAITTVTTNQSGKNQRALKQGLVEKTGYLHVNTKVFLHKLLLTTERKVAVLQWKSDRNFLNWLSKLTSSKMGQNSIFSSACMLSRFSRVWLFVTPWTVACQAPLSMRFSKQEYWNGLPFPSPGYGMSDKNITWIYSWENVRNTQIEGHLPSPPQKNHAEIQCDPGLDSVSEKRRKKKKGAKKAILGTLAKSE